MPIQESAYRPPCWLRNGHALTLWPVLFRTLPPVPYRRERVETPDGDFFDLDRLPAADDLPLRGVVIMTHGLEGNAHRKYMRGMALALAADGWDIVARNMRGCSGEINRRKTLFHMGETHDLHLTVQRCVAEGYRRIVLAGFSMGGNQSLKYLGEAPDRVPPEVQGAVMFSVPCALAEAAPVLDAPANAIYMEYFLRTLRRKMREKAAMFPDFPSVADVSSMHRFLEFDTRFTAPLYGFRSARDYWERSSCAPFLMRIRQPVLLVNAADDPFLTGNCYPLLAARLNPRLTLEIPEHGGHVGFVAADASGTYWSERRAVQFLRELFPAAENGAG